MSVLKSYMNFAIIFCIYFGYHFCKCNTVLVALNSTAEDDVLTSVTPIEVTALGRVAGLGEFYDARTDQFLHLSLFKSQLTSNIISTHNRETKIKFAVTNTFEQKFNSFDISAHLKLSMLGGLIEVGGSGQFLKETKRSAKSTKASLIYSSLTEFEQISITDSNVRSMLNHDLLSEVDATHLVVGIQWGGNVLISVEDTHYQDENKETVSGSLSAKLQMIFAEVSGSANVNISEGIRNEMNKLELEIFGDILPEKVPSSLLEALELIQTAPKLLHDANNGKGKAMSFKLIPITALKKLFNENVKVDDLVEIDEREVDKYINMFDEMSRTNQILTDISNDLNELEHYIDTSKVRHFRDIMQKYQDFQNQIKDTISNMIVSVRSGKIQPKFMEQLRIAAENHPNSWKNIEENQFYDLKRSISFLNSMRKFNVTLIRKDTNLEQFLWDRYNYIIHILFYNNEFPSNNEDAMMMFRNMIEHQRSPNVIYAAVKYEILQDTKIFALDSSSNRTKISCFQNMLLLHDDHIKFPYLKWQFSLANKNADQIGLGQYYLQGPQLKAPSTLWPHYTWLDETEIYDYVRITIVLDPNSPISTISATVHGNGTVYSINLKLIDDSLFGLDDSVKPDKFEFHTEIGLSATSSRLWKRTY